MFCIFVLHVLMYSLARMGGGSLPPDGRRFGRKEEKENEEERKKERKNGTNKKGKIEDLKKDLHALTRRVGEFEEREVLYTP